MFSAMACHIVNGLILCAQPVSTRYEVVISKSTPRIMEGATYHFIKSLSDRDVGEAVMGDWNKLLPMKGCKVTAMGKEYYYELPCSSLKKIIKCDE